ncbi:hypothetical protein OF122_01960 [Pelagibacterium flavum]|uniref:Uncharacterized protein n=1 Tax=Pelagibacterium flavum TaxID=2984530 RepID=A0ABY6IPT8_9HYPH|nr:hypothetical protein [Pelagibacterium sp. YIM 151497]UYQ72578.1 hypothetical protein OF122_01960 [Pelagibacterium sp. YIM 151497]
MEKVRKWALIGRLAAIVQKRQSGQPRLAFETDLAGRLGLSRGALRNYSDASRLVRDVPDPALRAVLFRSSAVAASIVGRWFRRDPDAVYRYLETALAGTPPRITDDRALLRAERNARQASPRSATSRISHMPADLGTQLAKILSSGDTHYWRPEIVTHLSRQGRLPAERQLLLFVPRDPLSDFLGVSQILIETHPGHVIDESSFALPRPTGPEIALGFIEIPERVTFERYRLESRQIWTRAIAAGLYLDLVVLVLPSSAARRHLLSSIPTTGAEWSHRPDASRPRRAGAPSCASRPVIARLPDPGAAIMVATRRSLLADLVKDDPRAARQARLRLQKP